MRRASLALFPIALATAVHGVAAAQLTAPNPEHPAETIYQQLQGALSEQSVSEVARQIKPLPTTDRAYIARRLADEQHGRASVAATLLALLEDRSTFVRAQAAASLAKSGAPAFPAMIAALASDRTIGSTGSPGFEPPRQTSHYLSWAFANSIDDPGSQLIAWARGRANEPSSRSGLKAPQFVAATLGARGEKAVEHARALLRSKVLDDQRLGLLVVESMGEAAGPLAPAISKLAFSSDPAIAEDSVTALESIGAAGQAELARLFTLPSLSELHADIAAAMEPGRSTLAAQLRVARSRDAPSRELAIAGLLEQPELPATAVPILLQAAREESARDDALSALSRSPLNHAHRAQVLQIAEAELQRALAAESGWADGALLALAAIEKDGLVTLRRHLREPQSRERACELVGWAAVGDDDSRPSTARARLEELSRSLCADFLDDEEQSEAQEEAELRAKLGSADAVLSRLFADDVSASAQNAVCSDLSLPEQVQRSIGEQLQHMSWDDLSELADLCPRMFEGPVTSAVVVRILAERVKFQTWADEDDYSAAELLGALSLGSEESSTGWRLALVELAQSPTQRVRLWAVRRLAHASAEPQVVDTLRAALRDSDREVAEAAAESLLRLEPDSPGWLEAARLATYFGLERDVENYIDEVGHSFRRPRRTAAFGPNPSSIPLPSPPSPSPPSPSPPPPPPPVEAERDIVTTGSRRSSLPKFPWPPPRYSSIVTFGRDVDRSLLGQPQDSLQRVHDRLVRALGAIDSNFESGLFAAPGGFVLLTRLEQTGEDGRPLPGRDRWRDVRPPPKSATDFLVRLFLAPPGYYRAIAFLFTDQANFAPGTAQLPGFDQGGTVLPDRTASVKFGKRHAFALVYAFRKRDTGIAQPYRLLSGREHLRQSGVVRALHRR